MTTVDLEVDDVQEFILQKVTDGETDQEDLIQAIFDDALWRVYQQWKASDGQPDVPAPDPEDD